MSSSTWISAVLFFFFQAEDGIRDATVTGVQTCALPICPGSPASAREGPAAGTRVVGGQALLLGNGQAAPGADAGDPGPVRPARGPAARAVAERREPRSEERRVGKEGGSQEARKEEKKKE